MTSATIATAEHAAVPAAGPAAGPADRRATRRPGRPRSEHADRAIIEAALELFAKSGVQGLCIEAVAARAGVGKSTIYRRWPGKEELLVDAVATLKSALPEPGGVSVRADLVAILQVMCDDLADPRLARATTLLLGEGARYPRLMDRFTAAIAEPRREVVRSVLRRGIAAGELRGDTDIEAMLFMLVGAIQTRGRCGSEAIPPGFAVRIVDHALRGAAAGPASCGDRSCS
jgi:AcrR family transcriptional regulator